MDWFDLNGSGKVIQIKEQVYRGFKCTWVENAGWKITLGTEEYLFSCFQDAKYAIDKTHEVFVKAYRAKKLKSVSANGKT